MSFIPFDNIVASIEEAKKIAPRRNFKQSVEMIIVLKDVDVKSPEGRIREVVFLPHPPRKNVKVCVVADGDMAVKARDYADRVITREELQGLAGNRKAAKKIAEECNWVLVRTDLMPIAGRILGPALGPRGKAPIPVPPNADIRALIERYRSAVSIRTKDQPQVMCRIGTDDMDPKEIAENAIKVLQTLESKLKNPQHNIGKIYVKLTMGPPVEVPLR
ncbi:MAG: 50S ribosomal protein L1 [Pyrodictiaceae archaeon]